MNENNDQNFQQDDLFNKNQNMGGDTPPIDQRQGIGFEMALPNSTAVLVLGILSIATCICYGAPGLVMGIIALILAAQSKKLYEENPTMYSQSSYNNLKAGNVCALIGTIISGLFLIFIFLYYVWLIQIFSTAPFWMLD